MDRKRILFGIGLIFWLGIPYVGLQFVAIREIYIVPPSWPDQLIANNRSAIFPYLSWYLLILVTHFSCCEKPCFRHWWQGAGAIGLISSLIFLFWPTGIVRGIEPQTTLHSWLLSIDQPRNVLPSLHASLAVYAGLIMQKTFNQRQTSTGFQTLLLTWVLLILWSTIAIRQHVAIDIAAGALLGIVVYAILAWNSD